MSESGKTTQTGRSLWADAWADLKRNTLAMFCLWIIGIFCATAIYGEIIYWRYNIINANPPAYAVPIQKLFIKILRAEQVADKIPPYMAPDMDNRYSPPSRKHLMGTDNLGRDVFLRVVQGTRIAFQVGIITSLIAIPLAVLLGCLAGYFGGWIDDLVVWLYSTFACMPSLLFILAISMMVHKGLQGVYYGIGLTTWVYLCRLIRAEVMKHKELTYVRAAKALGLSPVRIMFRHILLNVLHLVIINFSMRFPAAIETEVIMSFLGIGVQDEPSWGIMISNARFRLWQGVWWELAFTTLAIFLIVLAFNLFGDALRDALDPKLRTQSEKK
jgi:ABC-type dipeptide/oligopeptide/nickel transport system permease subunit